MAIASFTSSGSKATTAVSLPKAVFAVDVENHDLLKQAYVAHQANSRLNLAKTLKRGEVSGGGKKPWRQKGTGNARTGSIRNPIWRGGGITFGPQGNENYSKKINAKAKKQALKQALTLAVKSGKVSTIENFAVRSGKTSDVAKLVGKLGPIDRTIIVSVQFDEKTVKASSNLKDLALVKASNLSVVDVLDAKSLVITKDALAALEQRLGGDK